MVYLLSSMNRGELVQSLVEETGLPKNVVRAVVNALPTVVAKGIREGESISHERIWIFCTLATIRAIGT